jgi:hypothetical protein
VISKQKQQHHQQQYCCLYSCLYTICAHCMLGLMQQHLDSVRRINSAAGLLRIYILTQPLFLDA